MQPVKAPPYNLDVELRKDFSPDWESSHQHPTDSHYIVIDIGMDPEGYDSRECGARLLRDDITGGMRRQGYNLGQSWKHDLWAEQFVIPVDLFKTDGSRTDAAMLERDLQTVLGVTTPAVPEVIVVTKEAEQVPAAPSRYKYGGLL